MPTDPVTGSRFNRDGGHMQIVPDYSALPVAVTIGAASARSAQLSLGWYELSSTTALFFRQGSVTVAAANTGHFLPAGDRLVFFVADATTRGYIAAIQAAAAGVMKIHRLISTK